MSIKLLRQAYTLIEILVTISIIALLVALLMPAIQKIRETSKRLECANNLKQIGTAFLNHGTTRRNFPDSGAGWWLSRSKSSDGLPRSAPDQDWGWAYQILPYIEQYSLWSNPSDVDVAAVAVRLYFCPSRRLPQSLQGVQSGMPNSLRGAIDYAGNGGIGPSNFPADASFIDQTGVLIPRAGNKVSLADLPDGASNTLLVGERNFNRKLSGQSWMYDENNGYINGWDWDTIRWGYDRPAPDRHDDSYYDLRFGSSHTGGVQFVLADGSVRMVRYSISLSTFQNLCHRADGKRIEADAW